MNSNAIKKELIVIFKWRNKITAVKFCRLCHISYKTYKKVMTDDNIVRFDSLMKIANVLKINMFDLIDESRLLSIA